MTEPQKLPADHDCKKEGCFRWGDGPQHHNHDGLCLACGGCGDWQCCQHDESCLFSDEREDA